MANFGTILTVARTLSAALKSSLLKEICSIQSCQSQLEGLKETIFSLIEVLHVAETAQQLPPTPQKRIKLLKEAVYAADDFFDEILTLAKQQKHKVGKLSKKVRDFFSPNNPLGVETILHEVSEIKKTLGAMVNNGSSLGFKFDCRYIGGSRQGNYSHTNEDVIGLEEDVKSVIDMVLDSNVEDDVSFLTLGGVGGVGKTTLARFVYDDERVKTKFSLRLWMNLHGQNIDVNAILAEMVNVGDMNDAEWIQSKFLEDLSGKKFLLVLDDLGEEDHHKWTDLRKFLMLGGRGSRIVVTTRSEHTIRAIGKEYTYELKGLSPGDSWLLFGMKAFVKGREEFLPPELVEVGKKIVEKCPNVPLVIKVVGSLLFGQDISVWRSFEESGLGIVSEGENKNLSILKFSYYNLPSQLRSCFTYCALFPKGFIIDKEMLISLWMAQGYILPANGEQSIDDVAEEYFLILSQRCFLQVVDQDKYGESNSCKINSLMIDVAVEVAPQGTCAVGSFPEKFGDEFRHLFYVGSAYKEASFSKLTVFPDLHNMYDRSFPTDKLLAKWTRLRALDLHDLSIEMLPDSIGKLLHLRYLDLSNNSFRTLPHLFSKLDNLQTLNLSSCHALEELPKDFCKLVKLRHLNLDDCLSLSYMPSDMDKLTCLRMLTGFVVAEENATEDNSSRESEHSSEDEGASEDESSSEKSRVGSLNDVKALTNLAYIKICLPSFPNVKQNDGTAYLENMKHLKAVMIYFGRDHYDGPREDYYEERDSRHAVLLEKLQPHPNVKELSLSGYEGWTTPRWGRAEDNWASILPNLVKIKLECQRLQHLPRLCKLQHLKSLTVNCPAVEYMDYASDCEPGSRVAESTFYPSLQHLDIFSMPQLKGWWGVEDLMDNQFVDDKNWQPSFPHLSELFISACPDLISFPLCPSVETLHLREFNEKLNIFRVKDETRFVSTSSSSKSMKVELDNLGYLKSLPTGSLNEIKLIWDHKVERLSELAEVFKTCCALQSFTIWGCDNLRSLDGLEHLTSLESLSVSYAEGLTFCEADDDDMPWRSLQQSLYSLELYSLDSVTVLPKGMQYLTSLQTLNISECHNLKALPEWICYLSSIQSIRINSCAEFQTIPESLQSLTSLQRLELNFCKEGLKERCQNPDGDDWPKVQYIPNLFIYEAIRRPESLGESNKSEDGLEILHKRGCMCCITPAVQQFTY